MKKEDYKLMKKIKSKFPWICENKCCHKTFAEGKYVHKKLMFINNDEEGCFFTEKEKYNKKDYKELFIKENPLFLCKQCYEGLKE